jgi:hypothetical protein
VYMSLFYAAVTSSMGVLPNLACQLFSLDTIASLAALNFTPTDSQ